LSKNSGKKNEEIEEVQPEQELHEEPLSIPQEEQRTFYRKKYEDIMDIEGIGPSTKHKLQELGFSTIESLATASVHELTKEEGIGEDIALKLIHEARKTVSLGFITADEMMQIRDSKKYLTTGCSNIDALLKGGVETESITEFYAEFGGGKSQICHQLAVTVQLPLEKGGLNGRALYIDTEDVFQPKRCIQIGERFGLNAEKVLDNIIIAEAYTSAHQMALLEAADTIIKQHNIKLVIVDSATGQFRSEYPGREFLARRQQQLNKHLTKLQRMARVFKIAAVITNQVSAKPDSYFGNAPEAIGGNIVGHVVHERVYIRKVREPGRIAKVVASPRLAVGEVPFYITEDGCVSAQSGEETEEEEE